MSNDHLLLSVGQIAQAVAALRGHPPLLAAVAACEEPGADPFEAARAGLAEYLRMTAGSAAAVDPPTTTVSHGAAYSVVRFTDPAVPAPQRAAAVAAVRPTAERLSNLLRELPESVLGRLGFRSAFGAPLHDWVWVLFHLAWHFPDHFGRGVVRRERLLADGPKSFAASEDWLQLEGVTPGAADRHPGVIFSRFPAVLDLVTATGYAVDLVRQALRAGCTTDAPDAARAGWARLHREFAEAGSLAEAHPAGPFGPAVEARVLRLDSTFHTPPAAAWAGYEASGVPQEVYFLGRSGCVKEACVLRGLMVADFVRRADRAGALLPAWPEVVAPALLADAATWGMRVARRRELQSQQFRYATPDGGPPDGQPVPRSEVAQLYWNTTRPSPDWGGLVTDHRGNVERWLGLVFHVLKDLDPDAVELRTVPEGHHGMGPGWNAVLTLRGMNVYQAAARAMELAGLAPLGCRSGERHPTPAAQPVFDDPGPTDSYPPPGAGRYIRFRREAVPEGAEPEWRWGWAWADRPQDGWVECTPSGVGPGTVLHGLGTPPGVCRWLPPDWPAEWFPLGDTTGHLAGWRSSVLGILTENRDTVPPDHREFGWRTLTKAARALAHHLNVVPFDRLVAPLPASQEEARREVEPLLDGLVARARPRPARQPDPATAVPPQPAPPPAPPREAPVWNETSRKLSFRGRVCKEFKKNAPDQEKVLAAFHEEGWPEAVDDPLDDGKLARTVESLNKRLEHVRFRLNGAGTGVRWEPA